MELKNAPSGTFRYAVREATFGDERQRAKHLPEDTWTYNLGAATRTPNSNDADKLFVEVWLGISEIEIPDPAKPDSWKPLPIDKEKKYYKQGPFTEWLEERTTTDVIAMHQAVLEANPNWNRLGLPTTQLASGPEAS